MPWYAIAALMLAVFAPSAWSGVSAGCAVLSAMILGALGVKMLGLGLAGYMDPRNRPFGLARDYARWCKASGRRPV